MALIAGRGVEVTGGFLRLPPPARINHALGIDFGQGEDGAQNRPEGINNVIPTTLAIRGDNVSIRRSLLLSRLMTSPLARRKTIQERLSVILLSAACYGRPIYPSSLSL